jgi:hypothetical protein
MKHAIEALETKLETLRHNEPIHRAEGNVEQAVLDALTGIRAWMDDDQVAELTVRKYWESDKNGPQEYPPGASIRIVALVENG